MSCGSRSNNLKLQHCEAYGRCKSWAAKASFRTEWDKSALWNLQTSKQHSKSYQEVEVSRQDQHGFSAAMSYHARATELGGQMDETERHDRQSRILVPSERVHEDLV